MADKTHSQDVIKLKILRWGHDPGLSGYALNVITYALTRRKLRRSGYRAVGVMMKTRGWS